MSSQRKRYDGSDGLLFTEEQYKAREYLRKRGIDLRRANSLVIGHREPTTPKELVLMAEVWKGNVK